VIISKKKQLFFNYAYITKSTTVITYSLALTISRKFWSISTKT